MVPRCQVRVRAVPPVLWAGALDTVPQNTTARTAAPPARIVASGVQVGMRKLLRHDAGAGA